MSAGSQPPAPQPAAAQHRLRVVCFVNGIFSDQIGGGDIYFAHIARAALAAGYRLHFFGGHAFRDYLVLQGFPLNLTLTDKAKGNLGDVTSLGGQFRLLFDFAKRVVSSLRRLREVKKEDCAYAMSDFWFDSIPLMLCRAHAKILYLGMLAPTLREVITRGRPDVPPSRLPSLYFWLSQQFSLRFFRLCRGRTVTYSHPTIGAYLKRIGYRESELVYAPNGMDVAGADHTPEQPKEFDLAWTGRVHPQKGIDDLLASMERLAAKLPDFRAIIIGRNRENLEPVVRARGLEKHVTFAGLVSEPEKFRLLKASRVFVMPSRYESWGIVVGEALAAGIPVIAYELDCYRPVFGDFIRYAKCFDQTRFLELVEREVVEMRAGRNYLSRMDLPKLKAQLNWTAAQNAFCGVLAKVEKAATQASSAT